MKSLALVSVTAVLVCTGAFAGDYINGQAARMIIGQATFTDQLPGTTARLLGAAGGVAYGKDTLIIADSSRLTGLTPQNRRVLIYRNVSSKLPSATAIIPPYTSTCPVCTANSFFPFDFDVVLGQVDFTKNDPAVSQAGMRLPTAVATDGTILAVADTENNRILIWKSIPASINTPADIELGQDNFTTVKQPVVVSNKTFRGPQGVWIQDGKFFVADTQNHRVMIWNSIPTTNNQPADIVLGQPNFNVAPEPDLTRIGTSAHANTLLNPVSVTSDGKKLYVTDLGFSRVLIWNSIPTQTQQPADVALGQPDLDTTADNNSAKMCPSNGTATDGTTLLYPARCAGTLSFPRFALSDGQRLYISDGGNDRVLVFKTIPTASGTAADIVLGQPDMASDVVTSAQDLFNPNLERSASDVIPAPAQMAWDGQNLYVADPTDRRVLVFSPQSADIQRDGVRNAFSLNVFAVSTITFTAAPKENDEITITIAKDAATTTTGTDYKFKATGTSKIADMINGLVNVINSSNNGVGDPYILAIANPTFNLITLTARQPGDAGFNLNITTALSTGAQVAITLSKSNPTVQSAQRIAPGTIISIFGNDLSPVTASAPPLDANNPKLPFEVGGVQVYVNGSQAPVFSVAPNQVNAQLPFDAQYSNSVSVWVLSKNADGSIRKVTSAVPVPITQANPGISADVGNEPRRAFAYHSNSQASVSIAVDGTIVANDKATITIEDRSYSYTIQSSDTLATVRDALIGLINANGDEKLIASPGGSFTRVILKAKIPGPAGNGIPVAGTVSASASVILSSSKAATCCASVAGSPITVDDPAQAGEVITIYGTGLGVVQPDAARAGQNTGEAYGGPALNDPLSFLFALAGGRTANTLSAGAKVGSVGLYEVVIELNSDLPTNPQTQLTIAQDIYTSNIVTIPVVNPHTP